MLSFDRPRLSELFVLCPRLCEHEGDEHNKILYYFPDEEKSSDEKLNSIGLCEALMAFTNFFGSQCKSLHTSVSRRFLRQMAEDVWIVMVITLPPHSKSIPSEYYALYHEHDADLSDQVMGAVLATACQTFELFNGKVECLMRTEGIDVFRRRLDHFFSRYLRLMLFEHSDLLSCFNGIHFTSVEPSDFARVQGFLNRTRYAFRAIRHLAFFYDGRLVVATLDLDYARHLYNYLNSFLFAEPPDWSQSTTVPNKGKHFGRFLVGPRDFSNLEDRFQCPVLCSPGSDFPDSQLVTYQALRVVLCIVVAGTDPLPMKFFAQFDAMVGPRLTVIADRITANLSNASLSGSTFSRLVIDESIYPTPIHLSSLGAVTTPEDGLRLAVEDIRDGESFSTTELGRARFVYWNPSMYSVMSTLHVFTGSGIRQIGGARLVLNLMLSLRAELQLKPSDWHEEIVIRLDPHVWLVARRSNGRELFMVFVRKQENLNKLGAVPLGPPESDVRLDLTGSGSMVVLLKRGTRICGQGCARSNAPIVQDKAYFEVKIQSAGENWAIGLSSIGASLESISELRGSQTSWLLLQNGSLWNSGQLRARLLTAPEEGDIIGVSYDHSELQFSVNGQPRPILLSDGKSRNGLIGMRGVLYPVVGVAADAVLDVAFSARHFYYAPPKSDYEQILFEKDLIQNNAL